MKLTKQTEAELLKAYYDFWESNLSADMEKFSSYLVDDFSIFGSANGEVFFSKQDAVKFYTATADQMRGKAELRNRKVSMQPLDTSSVIVLEESDLYVLIGNEWTFYGHARISCIAKKIDGSWKALHQHASFADHRTEEGQQLASEKIEKENLELREAVKRRTVELESKNRDLEIEAALERVRTVAMGMNKPEDMLNICRIISQQLEFLNVKHIRNVQTAIIYESKGTYLNYEYYVKHDKLLITEVAYNLHTEHAAFVNKMLESPETFYTHGFAGKELNDWYAYQKTTSQFADSYLEQATSLNYYMHSIGGVVLGMSTYTPLKEEEINLFKRFRNVFDLAYKRFVDIEKAEAQAREAQIQLALERVRARTMAMQKSEELKDVIRVVFDQIVQLNIKLDHAGFVVEYKPKADWHFWIADEQDIPAKISHPYFESVWANQFNEAKEKGSDFFATKLDFEEKNKFYKELLSYVPGLPETSKIFYLSCPGLAATTVMFDDVSLYIENFAGIPYSDEETNTLIRFGKVFQQTYTRFLDLQKAEAQTREAQIEAGLERVRGKTMAMHNSQDVGNTVAGLFDELVALGLEKSARCGIGILDESDTMELWTASANDNGELILSIGHLGMTLHPLLKGVKETWSSKKESFTYELQGEDLINYFNTLNDYSDYTIYIDVNTLPDKIIHNSFYFTDGLIYCFTPNSISEDIAKVVKRFAGVFEQTYTRFLDLQKAEAQTKESQIQLALERVRARTMAMQHSNELADAAVILFQQVKKLGIETYTSGFNIWNEEAHTLVSWMSNPSGILNPPFIMPATEYGQHKKLYEAWKSKLHFIEDDLTGENIVDHYKYLRSFPLLEMAFANAEKAGIQTPDRQVHNVVFFSQGYLLFVTLEPKPEFHDLFQRFGQVFQQTYTRFLDLQKAEAQAREARIEVSLERVRAQSMAMHHPDDLDKVNKEILKQLNQLQIPGLTGVTFYLINENGWVNAWDFSSPGNIGTPNSYTLQFDFNKYEMMGEPFRVFQQSDQDYFVADYPLEKLEKAVYEIEEINPAVATVVKEALANGKLTHQWSACARISSGLLGIDLIDPPSEDTKTIVLKIASAFNQAYTRFLDLQKAEVQTRAAQIELAVERVRAKALAMHSSTQILDVVVTLRNEMLGLDIPGVVAATIYLQEKEDHIRMWDLSSVLEMKEGFQVTLDVKFKLQETDPGLYMRRVWNNQEHYFVEKQEAADMAITLDWLKQYYPEQADEAQQFFNTTEWKYLLHPTVKLAHGKMSVDILDAQPPAEMESILVKMGVAFDLAYKRFLDLQQSEKQIKEAKIELALERVRARTMAMQKSDELRETVLLINEQLQQLNFESKATNIIIIDKDTGNAEYWVSGFTKDIFPVSYFVPYFDHPYYEALLQPWKEGNQYAVNKYEGDGKKNFDKIWFTKTDFKNVPEEAKNAMMSLPSVTLSTAYFSNGALQVIGPEALSEEKVIMLNRFAKVFEQTYTRFLDLQKAEAQAREAQIEAALERVRSKSMAMHKSEELADLSLELVKQVHALGVETWFCAFNIYDDDPQGSLEWGSNGQGTFPKYRTPREKIFLRYYKAGQKGETLLVNEIGEKECPAHYEYLCSLPGVGEQLLKMKAAGIPFPASQIDHVAYFKYGYIIFISYNPVPEAHDVFKRFAKVFEQTYTRFLDLQKAEAQAKEAQIEAALERVRGKAMSMHSSQDLSDTIHVFYRELQSFSITPRRCGVGLLNKQNREGEVFTWNTTEQGESLELVGKIKMEGHPVLENIYKNWIARTEYHPVLKGNEIKEYYRKIRPQMAFPDYEHDAVQYGYFFYFNEGGVYAWTEKEMHEDEVQIYRRFTTVLSLTYKRYIDLKQAEANAKEAVKQAALDRIRADIASMRTISDLGRITPLVWNELTILGIPFIRCGVFIMDDAQQLIHTFLSTPDGKAIAAFHLPYDTPGNIGRVVTHWKAHKNYIDHWDENEFYRFAEILVKQGALDSAENYLKTIPKGGFSLHFLPFLQGMLYVGNTSRLNDEQIELIQHVAGAFATAYARYQDFNKLEAAKQKVENTLQELKQTQDQLIQAEKLASLGQLTAGIAHEIKNPLNFINNFSDVSMELIDEVINELNPSGATESKQEISALLADVKSNLGIIHQHGLRADGIVRSMLLHSRSSTGKKEITDLNALIRENVNLAFHAMRAGKSPFTVEINFGLDAAAGAVPLIIEDFSRVILNLCTNAFDAMREKLSMYDPDGYREQSMKYEGVAVETISKYSPTLTVKTKRAGEQVMIEVEDNGTGIPAEIRDKILQPFFTTKKGTLGTGLGLSITHDIIKAHGGKLEIESEANRFCRFIIFIS